MTAEDDDQLDDLRRHAKSGPEWRQAAEGGPVSNINYVYEGSDAGSRADQIRTRLELLAREWDPAEYVFLLPDFPSDLEDRADSFRVLVFARKK